jgi:hypothetical protein
MSLRVLKLVAVNVLVFVVLAEAVGLYASYMDTGHFLYTTPRHYDAIKETAARRLTADSVHPYFGPLHKPGFRPQFEQLRVHLAVRVSLREAQRRRARDRHLRRLRRRAVLRARCATDSSRTSAPIRALNGPSTPLGAGRKFVPLCFSHEGYKQPQQLLVLAYFLSIGQRFDLVLNIDGPERSRTVGAQQREGSRYLDAEPAPHGSAARR